ncbi:MAG TPA: hypothetical protein VH796_09810 [Nitrososphaeraceae archaeon]|jgi:hypothetical protein
MTTHGFDFGIIAMVLMSNKTTILTIGAFLIGSLIIASIFSYPAFALTRYFNCVIREVNKNGKFTLDDANVCYDKEFPHSGSNSDR